VAGDELLEAHRLEPAVRLGDRARLHLAERGDGCGVLDCVDLIVHELCGPNRHDRAELLTSHPDGLDRDRPAVERDDRPAAGVGRVRRIFERQRRAPPQQALGPSRDRLDVPLAVDDRDRPADRVGQRLRDLRQPAAAQHDRRESVVDLGGPLQADRLGVQDDGQDRVDDVAERAVMRKLDQRKAELVRGRQHLGRDLVDVSGRLQGKTGEASSREARDQPEERGPVIPERVGRRQEELVRVDPAEDVRHLHDVHVPDPPVEAGSPRDDPGVAERVEIQDVAKWNTDHG
jgi:hypothetical protein